MIERCRPRCWGRCRRGNGRRSTQRVSPASSSQISSPAIGIERLPARRRFARTSAPEQCFRREPGHGAETMLSALCLIVRTVLHPCSLVYDATTRKPGLHDRGRSFADISEHTRKNSDPGAPGTITKETHTSEMIEKASRSVGDGAFLHDGQGDPKGLRRRGLSRLTQTQFYRPSLAHNALSISTPATTRTNDPFDASRKSFSRPKPKKMPFKRVLSRSSLNTPEAGQFPANTLIHRGKSYGCTIRSESPE